MKWFQAALLLSVLAMSLRVLLGPAKTLPRCLLRWSGVGVFGLLAFVATRPERSWNWSLEHPLALQFVMLDEDDIHPYRDGLVATPRAWPVPAFAGHVIAVAGAGARLKARWDGERLVIAAELPNGSPGVLLCGVAMHRGVPLAYQQAPAVFGCEK